MKPLKNKVSITLDADIIDKIKELAEEDDRSFSQYINLVLREHIKNLDKSEKWQQSYATNLQSEKRAAE